jgi:hypothetical protein
MSTSIRNLRVSFLSSIVIAAGLLALSRPAQAEAGRCTTTQIWEAVSTLIGLIAENCYGDSGQLTFSCSTEKVTYIAFRCIEV